MLNKNFHKMTLNESGRPFYLPPAYLDVHVVSAGADEPEAAQVDVTCPHGTSLFSGAFGSIPHSSPLHVVVAHMLRKL